MGRDSVSSSTSSMSYSDHTPCCDHTWSIQTNLLSLICKKKSLIYIISVPICTLLLFNFTYKAYMFSRLWPIFLHFSAYPYCSNKRKSAYQKWGFSVWHKQTRISLVLSNLLRLAVEMTYFVWFDNFKFKEGSCSLTVLVVYTEIWIKLPKIPHD